MAVGLGAAASEIIRLGEECYARQGQLAQLLRDSLTVSL